MRKHPVAVAIAFVVRAFAFMAVLHEPVEGQSGTTPTAAVPNDKGGPDVFGAYDVAQWPKPLTTLAGHETSLPSRVHSRGCASFIMSRRATWQGNARE